MPGIVAAPSRRIALLTSSMLVFFTFGTGWLVSSVRRIVPFASAERVDFTLATMLEPIGNLPSRVSQAMLIGAVSMTATATSLRSQDGTRVLGGSGIRATRCSGIFG